MGQQLTPAATLPLRTRTRALAQMAAESIGLSSLDESVAVGLAGDVEFRLHQVIEVSLSLIYSSGRSPCSAASWCVARVTLTAPLRPRPA
jgi:hypothetical protein